MLKMTPKGAGQLWIPHSCNGRFSLRSHAKLGDCTGLPASQVSMWLAKEFGARYETFALEATGYQCWALKGLQADIDLSDPHPQIVTYRARWPVPGRLFGHWRLRRGGGCPALPHAVIMQ